MPRKRREPWLMKRILIVDDENLIRYSLSAALRQDDTYVKAVECGKDALSEINHIFYDLCFLDVNLPDMNGLDLMKVVKKSSPATKIVIMTGGVVDAPEMLQSIQANANLLLPKPFDLDRIKLFVDRIIGQGMSIRRSGGAGFQRKRARTIRKLAKGRQETVREKASRTMRRLFRDHRTERAGRKECNRQRARCQRRRNVHPDRLLAQTRTPPQDQQQPCPVYGGCAMEQERGCRKLLPRRDPVRHTGESIQQLFFTGEQQLPIAGAG